MATDEELIVSVVNKANHGKITCKKQLDKELDNIGMILIPYYEWKESKTEAIEHYRIRINELNSELKNYYFFIAGLIISFVGSPTLSLKFISLIICLIISSGVFIYLIKRKIKGIKIIQGCILPNIFIY